MSYTANDFKALRAVRKYEIEKKKAEIKKKIIFSGIIFLFIFFSGFFMTTYADASNTLVVSYQVKPGDTLWQIASEFNESNKEIREYIYDIKKINKIDSGFILPGQVLVIPLYKNYK